MARDGTQRFLKSENGVLDFRYHHFLEQRIPLNYGLLYELELLFLCFTLTFSCFRGMRPCLFYFRCVDTLHSYNTRPFDLTVLPLTPSLPSSSLNEES